MAYLHEAYNLIIKILPTLHAICVAQVHVFM